MMRKTHMFKENIEVPEIVLQKVEDALAKIQAEGTETMSEKQKLQKKAEKKVRFLKSQAAAIACILALAATGITAAAAVHYFWSRGMQGTIQATGEQQQALMEQGMATRLEQAERVPGEPGQPENGQPGTGQLENGQPGTGQPENGCVEPVTVGNITISPMETIVDGYFAYLSFRVAGYELPKGEAPGFEHVEVSLTDETAGTDVGANMGASFYDGIVADAHANPVYEDGTPLEFTKQGDIVGHYEAADGSLEYVMILQTADINSSLIGKTAHISFENLGAAKKAEVETQANGKWEFEILLSGQSAGVSYPIGRQLDGTVFTVDSIELSPISAKVNYTVNGTVNTDGYENGVPEFTGVVLKDGTELNYLANGGMNGYVDETMQKAFDLQTFDRVIDAGQVEAVLLRRCGEAELCVIPLH